VRIYEKPDEPLPLSGGVLRLEELREYFVASDAGAATPAEAFLGPLALVWDEARRAFRLPVRQWAGTQVLRVVTDGREWTAAVKAVPCVEKVSEQGWAALLTDLEAWLPGLSVGEQPGLQGAVFAGGPRLPQLVEALLPLLPGLLRAVQAVIDAPRERTERRETFVQAHRVRRVERATLGWLERHPAAARALGGRWDTDVEAKRRPFVPVEHAAATLDHPANRYVAWLVRSIASDLKACATPLESVSLGKSAPAGTDAEDWVRWCSARAKALRTAASSLEGLWRGSWLSSLTPSPPTEAAMAVVVDDPLYARLHRLGRRFRSPLFRFESAASAPGALTRPTYELYELWTFLALRRLLQELVPAHQWHGRGLAPLASLGKPLRHTAFEAKGPGGSLTLLFNPTFPGYLARGDAARFSVSGERRPDLVLLWDDGTRRRWVCLDAKYRVSRDGLADAFASAHLYRDGLRWAEWGGRCEAAVLLAPAELPACAPWYSASFLAEHQVGVFRVTPGGQHDALAGWLKGLLGV
jgi:hypothetical protein